MYGISGKTVFMDKSKSCSKDVFDMAKSGDLKSIKSVLKNIEYKDSDFSKNGMSILWIASFMGYAEMVEFLIVKGADVNMARPQDGQTPLHASVHFDNIDVFIALMANGADKDIEGGIPPRSPIRLANRHYGNCGRSRIWEYIVANGLDVKV